MKKYILILLLTTFVLNSFSQKRKDRIKTLKIAYITDKLDLNSEESIQFWPIYNTYSKLTIKKRKATLKYRRYLKENGGIDSLTENQAIEYLKLIRSNEDKIYIAKNKMITDLKKVISNKKIVKLLIAEKEFNRRILNRLKKRRNSK